MNNIRGRTMELSIKRKTPRKEIKARISTFQEALMQLEVDLAIVVQNADLFYFSGTIQGGYLLIPMEGEPVFAATGDAHRIEQESGIDKIVPITGIKEIPGLCKEILRLEPRTVGLEFDVLPVSLYHRVCALLHGCSAVDVSNSIRKIRMLKSSYEINKIRESAMIYGEALSHLPEILRPGITEVDLESELVRLARRRSHFGAHRVRGFNQESYYGHVLAGPRGAVPSMLKSPTGGLGSTPAFGYGSGHWAIEENSPILIDMCFGIDGYLADQTRTAVIGKLPASLNSAYEKLLTLKKEIEGLLRPGAICEEVYFQALDKAESLGLTKNFMGAGERKARFVGHGIGLEMDEWPVIGKGFRTALAPGMVLAVEPKLIFHGIGAIGLEDNYVITEEGCENLTPLDECIIEI